MWTRTAWRVVEMVSSADLLFWMVPGLSQLFSRPERLYNPGLAWLADTCASVMRQHTQALQCPHDKGEDHPCGVYSWFLTFQGQRALSAQPNGATSTGSADQHATELWSTCWCSLKGTRMRKRHSLCLTLSQWFQTLPIHLCLPWATSLRLPFRRWIVGPPGCLMVDEWSPLLWKGNSWVSKNMDVYINQAPEVVKSIFIIWIFL